MIGDGCSGFRRGSDRERGDECVLLENVALLQLDDQLAIRRRHEDRRDEAEDLARVCPVARVGEREPTSRRSSSDQPAEIAFDGREVFVEGRSEPLRGIRRTVPARGCPR